MSRESFRLDNMYRDLGIPKRRPYFSLWPSKPWGQYLAKPRFQLQCYISVSMRYLMPAGQRQLSAIDSANPNQEVSESSSKA